MKKQVVQILAIASLLSATVVAQTPSPSPGDIGVSIPFEFRVAGRVLRPGGYTIYKQASGLRLCEDESNCVDISAMALASGPTLGQARLAFHRYANQNILTQVWLVHTTYELTPIHMQASQVKAVAPIEIVLIDGSPLCIHQSKGEAMSWH